MLKKRLPSNQYTPYGASLNNNINNNKIFLHLGVGIQLEEEKKNKEKMKKWENAFLNHEISFPPLVATSQLAV